MASGDQVAFFWATEMHALAAGVATPDTRNGHPVYDFDGFGDEEAFFEGFFARTYAGGSVKVRLFVGCTTATSGTFRFQTDFERITAGSLDTDADSFSGTFQSAGLTVAVAAGIFQWLEITHTSAQIDGIQAGDLFRLKVRRDADGTSGTDDITSDVELMAVEIQEL